MCTEGVGMNNMMHKIRELQRMEDDNLTNKANSVGYKILNIDKTLSPAQQFITFRARKYTTNQLYLALKAFNMANNKNILTAGCSFVLGVMTGDYSLLKSAKDIVQKDNTIPIDLKKSFLEEITLTTDSINQRAAAEI